MAVEPGSGNFNLDFDTTPDLSDVPTEHEITKSDVIMSSPPRFKKSISLSQKPIVAAVLNEALKIFDVDKDDFQLAEEFVDTDPTVGGNADALAQLVQKAYRGPRIRPRVSDQDEGGNSNQKIARKIALGLEQADDLLYDLDFKGILYSSSINMFQDGDVIFREVPGVNDFEMLPRRYVTALPEQYIKKVNGKLKSVWSQMYGPGSGNFNAIMDAPSVSGSSTVGQEILMRADYYIVNEGTESEIVYPKDEIIHIKMNPYGRTTIDQKGRVCFNLWSSPPMKRLKKTLLWKANAMVNDILWRDAMPPREHHRIDLSLFTPDNYEGDSPEARVEAARTAALRVINAYIKYISHKAVDVGYVTDLVTEIDILESKAKTYADPNELIQQLDQNIHATSGIPRGAMYGESRGAYASELLISNYAGLRAEFIGHRISRPFEKWLTDYIGRNYPDTIGKKIARRIRLKFRLILPRDVREMAQAVNLLMDSMVVDVAQIMSTVGLDQMTDEQFTKHLATIKKINETQPKVAEVDKKSFKKDAKSESRKQETSVTRTGKEMNIDNPKS